MTEVHLIMMRYSMDGSPLNKVEDYPEMVRFVCAELDNAKLLVNRLQEDNFKEDTQYFIRSHPLISAIPNK